MHASYTGIQTAELYLQSSAPHHILHRTEYSKLPVRTAIENRMFEKLPLHLNIPPTLNYVINATKINLELKITQPKGTQFSGDYHWVGCASCECSCP
jgi:hypothetical protein